MGSVSDVSALFAVCGFAWLGLESCCWLKLSQAVFQGQISRLRFSLLEAIFSCLFLLSGFCKRRCGSFCGCGFAWLGLESCCCLRLSEAVFQGQISRLRFSLLEAIFSCLFLLSGFCKRRFDSFCGCGFAWLGLESCCCLRLSEAVSQGQISRLRFSLLEAIFSCLFLLSGFCKRRFGSFCGCGFAWLGLESCCCLRLSEAVFQGQISRLRFSLLEAIFSCLFLLSGFCKRRCGSFCGCGFTWLGLESCCCLRLSEAVFQGQISRLRFSLLEVFVSYLFLLSGFCKRRFGTFGGCGFAWLGLESCCWLKLSQAVFQGQISRLRFSLLEAIFSCIAAVVLHGLGSNPAAVWGFRKRSSKVRFRDSGFLCWRQPFRVSFFWVRDFEGF